MWRRLCLAIPRSLTKPATLSRPRLGRLWRETSTRRRRLRTQTLSVYLKRWNNRCGSSSCSRRRALRSACWIISYLTKRRSRRKRKWTWTTRTSLELRTTSVDDDGQKVFVLLFLLFLLLLLHSKDSFSSSIFSVLLLLKSSSESSSSSLLKL